LQPKKLVSAEFDEEVASAVSNNQNSLNFVNNKADFDKKSKFINQYKNKFKLKRRNKPRKEIVGDLNSNKSSATSSEIVLNDEPIECFIDSEALASFISEYYAKLRNFSSFGLKTRSAG
jgi:hypothetical protein